MSQPSGSKIPLPFHPVITPSPSTTAPPNFGWAISTSNSDFENGALRANSNKLRFSLMPIAALEAINEVFEYGAKKYTENNWKKGFYHLNIYDSLIRHLFAWAKGEDKDPESGLSHLAHAGCNMLMLLEHSVSNLGTDNRGTK